MVLPISTPSVHNLSVPLGSLPAYLTYPPRPDPRILISYIPQRLRCQLHLFLISDEAVRNLCALSPWASVCSCRTIALCTPTPRPHPPSLVLCAPTINDIFSRRRFPNASASPEPASASPTTSAPLDHTYALAPTARSGIGAAPCHSRKVTLPHPISRLPRRDKLDRRLLRTHIYISQHVGLPRTRLQWRRLPQRPASPTVSSSTGRLLSVSSNHVAASRAASSCQPLARVASVLD